MATENIVIQNKRMSDVMLIDNGLKEMHQMAKVICETLGVKTDIVANG